MKTEADVKRAVIDAIKKEGGYGRRFEDQYAVGIPDTILIPKGGLVYFAEFKIIRKSNEFGVTPRQLVELQRIAAASPYPVICMIGYGPTTKRLYIGAPSAAGVVSEMGYVEYPWNISELLNKFNGDK